jgi:hypothetical protein
VSSLSDFTKAIARVSEGFCPLCDGELPRTPTLKFTGGSVTRSDHGGHIVVDEAVLHSVEDPGFCLLCGVGFGVETVAGKPALRTSRALTKDEIQKLYDREGGS